MKWEYLLTNLNSNRERAVDELNRFGEEEWEAVAILDDGHPLMKRPKRDRSDSSSNDQTAGFRAGPKISDF
jgi:hypothetical protein